jgi:hypothetical protein
VAAEPLIPEDARILSLESELVVGHTCKLLVAERAGDDVLVLRRRVDLRGPGGPARLAGGRITAAYSLAEIAPRHALRVSALSFAGGMTFGLCADANAVPDLDVLAAGVADSIDELAAGP